ncbi:putative peptidylprolyl isomerase [Helianthus annuus]|nr:putative peptidylprolyl isomerase [Helianthus annuus]
MSKKNPLVYLDVSIDGDPIERMVFELFSGEKGNGQKTGRPCTTRDPFSIT